MERICRTGPDPSCHSCISGNPQGFFLPYGDDGGRKRICTARGWEDLSWLLKSYEALGKQADQEVVHQYIQHWKIAKDFAVYLELYKKYRKDYGFDGILEGKWKKETLEKLNYAAFDERLSVVSLLLSQLNDRFFILGTERKLYGASL